MLLETEESVFAGPSSIGFERRPVRRRIHWQEVAKLAAIVLQLGLLAILIKRYNLESPAFFQLTVLAFAGFIVHYFLPLAYRLPFFLALSIAGIVMVLGPTQAVWLVGVGLLLIGLCHVPLPFWVRIALLVSAGALLAMMRAGWLPTVMPVAIWPILASMFVFRLVVYLYDLRYQTAPFSIARSLSYFFLLPNVCFPLFPVVDYQSFCRNYYDTDRFKIYQVGASWLFRGVVHLILYRILYKNWSISLYDVADAGDLAHYCLWSFLLYLRVSGQFHVIVGLLHLFGFNLMETHHLYYLASSFTDFWRRINIYWKDFMMKVFFYPAYFRLRNRGPLSALVISTALVFLVTWVLHAAQWYWLRGTFLFEAHDILFWSILAGLVVANSLWEIKRGRQRATALGSLTWKGALAAGMKTLATFTVICILWSMWSSESLDVWLELWRFSVVPPTAHGWLIIGGAAVAVFGGAVLMAREPAGLKLGFFQESALRCGLMCLLAAVSVSFVHRRLGYAGELIASARSSTLNREDQIDMEQGYYEGLLAVDKFNSQLSGIYQKVPAEWTQTIVEAGLATPTNNFQRFELKASSEGMFKGVMLRTNRWGMNDKEYPKEPPAGGYRIAMLGASHAMGTGVEREKGFETLLEDRLNRENEGAISGEYEILNFSVWAYRPIQQIKVLQENVLPFKPNAIFYVEHPGDTRRLLVNLAEAISDNIQLPYPELREICAQANIDNTLAEPIIKRRLRPYANEILTWVYHRIVRACNDHQIKPIFVSLPTLNPEVEQANIALAKSAGFEIVDLKGVYDGHTWWDLCLSEWDSHPTPEGHRLIAEKFYNELLKTRLIPTRNDDRAKPLQAGQQAHIR
jgi:hypothetical protein